MRTDRELANRRKVDAALERIAASDHSAVRRFHVADLTPEERVKYGFSADWEPPAKRR